MSNRETVSHMWDNLPLSDQLSYTYISLHPSDPERIIIFAFNMLWDVYPHDVFNFFPPEDKQKMINDFKSTYLTAP